MDKKIYLLLFFLLLAGACKNKVDDFLTRLPPDKMTDPEYWANEQSVRTFAWGFYPIYFTGYGSGWTWGKYFSGQSLNDDFAPTAPSQFTQNVPATSTGWSFTNVRKANLFIDRIHLVPMEEEAIKHWEGVGRFFRGMEYSALVRKFGDMPWYGKVLDENDTQELFRPRDPRAVVMDSVLADFKFAAENVRASDGEKGLTVNKYVVLAFMSKVFLFEGTWMKYRDNNSAKAKEYLEAAKWAADKVMTDGGYAVGPDYRALFSSLDLGGNPEMILYRRYETGLLTHCLMSYVNTEGQTGASKNAVESYLCKDGLPVGISPLYKGDKQIADVMTDRDPRMYGTFVQVLRLNGLIGQPSTTGYAVLKFLNDDIKDKLEGTSLLNPTDAPVIRYGEVLLNYAEACAELGTVTQSDLDRSINQLRSRAGVNIPPLQVVGVLPAVNGTVYDDPRRDPAVPAMIWEIRRERRIEMMMEGIRYDDLRRWGKLAYTDTKANKDINLGAWIKKSDYPPELNVVLENNAAEGYIMPAVQAGSQRIFSDPKVYLDPLPLDQIKLYKDQGVDLKQNPGWN
ncbi:RagB/SusD family nutrient uptake outer membrane protein [Chitinophaga sp. MM2321]|uniref:RagB/SusD family nutrient uptake outer membrane protein n=1 Tax=Chitinophaga sp. MM2321 TaxID=3137178 RepID=UPI0032D5A9B1